MPIEFDPPVRLRSFNELDAPEKLEAIFLTQVAPTSHGLEALPITREKALNYAELNVGELSLVEQARIEDIFARWQVQIPEGTIGTPQYVIPQDRKAEVSSRLKVDTRSVAGHVAGNIERKIDAARQQSSQN